MTDHVKVPSDRIGVIVGRGGSIRKAIESKSLTTLDIDSETGSVHLVYSKDPIGAMRAVDVITAIGRGFSPEKAFRLFDDEMAMLEIMDLSKVTSTPKELKRVKGRIIGKDGRTRDTIENLTSTSISIYGKTVGAIGNPEQIQIVRTAINMLIDGAPHSAVYGFLERKRKDLRKGGL